MNNKLKLINHIENCLAKTDNYNSKITDEIINIDGMTGKKTRHFYNNLCSMDNARYLEIGTWKGSSMCAAMCNNSMVCVGIDDWSEFGGPKDEFIENFNKFKGNNKATFIEKNCWDIDVSSIGNFNIYMYDGAHDKTSTYKALNHYLGCLDDEFIYLVDDWNDIDGLGVQHDNIRKGTMESIKNNNLSILYQKEIFTPSNDNKNDWHNGISIFVLRKN